MIIPLTKEELIEVINEFEYDVLSTTPHNDEEYNKILSLFE
jgi:hypothetical protein